MALAKRSTFIIPGILIAMLIGCTPQGHRADNNVVQVSKHGKDHAEAVLQSPAQLTINTNIPHAMVYARPIWYLGEKQSECEWRLIGTTRLKQHKLDTTININLNGTLFERCSAVYSLRIEKDGYKSIEVDKLNLTANNELELYFELSEEPNCKSEPSVNET